MTKLKPTQVLLTFETEEQATYVKTVCRRKGTTIEDYMVENLEWDDMPECLSVFNELPISNEMCHDCDYYMSCPDAVLK